MTDRTATRSRLEARLAELEGRQQHIAVDLSEPLDPDSSEQAVEVEDDAALEGQAALIPREIESVKRALARIEDGTYGQCVLCGAEISPARLDARPEAALCIDCARLNAGSKPPENPLTDGWLRSRWQGTARPCLPARPPRDGGAPPPPD